MLACQALVIMGTIDADVAFDLLARLLADLGEDILLAGFTHNGIEEVGMHSGTIPVGITQGVWMPLDGQAVILCGAFQQVTGNPDFITGAWRPWQTG